MNPIAGTIHETEAVSMETYRSLETAWCPGCGNFGILQAVKKALVMMGKRPHEVLLCSGIGQAAKLPHYLKCNVFNGLHGRALPAATAAKLANHDLTVLAVGGDGDMYGEGGNHFLHAMRRNIDVTLLVHDNRVYGLTKGQASPTSDQGIKTEIQPEGVISRPLNPMALAISQRCSFVAREFSGRIQALAELIKAGVENPGFSYIEILQPCVTFNRVNTHAFYKQRVYSLQDDDAYDPLDLHAALDKAEEWGDRIPVGIFFRYQRPSYHEAFGQLKLHTLIDKQFSKDVIGNIINEIQ